MKPSFLRTDFGGAYAESAGGGPDVWGSKFSGFLVWEHND